MKIHFFDANVFIGRPHNGVHKPALSIKDLLKEMDALDITRALVWHIAQYEESPVHGNAMLAEAISGQDRIYGVWTVLPPQTKEVIRDDFFIQMKKHRIAALRVFPDWHRFLANRDVFGAFLDELSERKIPLLLTFGRACIGWQQVHDLLREFPELVCILCDIGIWGVDRYTWPLLERYPNVYLETSLLSLEAGGLEAAVQKYGPKRFVFGTGFPERYGEAAILQLVHAEIPDSAKEQIAFGNLTDILNRERL
jgi:predicted TIM-barrel fold metal-dependent hydrolase